ncbi:MAG: hypothetical protein IJL94_00700 [Erysipelotrichaceae bacterium]|nr:hypothetical protein [Erysipelotrichaceae bacterium]
MNKKEITEALNEFPYERKNYWLITGAAMVLYGMKEQTHDIDLGCNREMADLLERDGYLYKITEEGNRYFRYGEDIEILENWLKDTVTEIEGFQVITVRGLIEMKRELGREKDLKDLELIREYMDKTASNCFDPEGRGK